MSFLRYDVFCGFSSKNFQKLKFNFFSVEFLTLYLEAFRITSAFANFAPKYDCSNLCSYLDRTFCGFSEKFSENLIYYFFSYL